ncbi:sensor histidine kinase [Inmirania thermothiophila]|uniref:histidine kinase n=1 Tax=Inmirania thermothiophila TaxID=1750597 RepID=A0A3N1Y6G8_9GAMM|nr:ATP-binding protein [Inmirania thermothiophila]ROR32907.1 phospho-acceptor domain-containing protein [Inmirania thermothiophila]
MDAVGLPVRRFRLARHFAVMSLFSVVAAALALGYLYRTLALRDLVFATQRGSIAFAHTLAEVMEPEITAVLAGLGRGDPAARRRLDEAIRHRAADFGAAKVRIFTPEGLIAYSTDPREIGGEALGNVGVSLAAGGEVVSGIVHRDRFNAYDRVREDRDLVQTYLPVRDRDGAVRAVFEVYADATDLVARMHRTHRTVVGGVALVLLALYGFLFLVVHRADQVLQVQDARLRAALTDLEQANETLEQRVAERTRELEREMAERERAQRELEVTRRMAWQREKMAAIGTLAAGIVHEIGNPLAGITGLVQSVLDEPGAVTDAGARERLELALQEAARIERIGRDVSEFAVPQHERRELLDLNELIGRTVRLLRHDERLRRIEIGLELDQGLPAVEGVADQLMQVVMNLVLNAADAVLDERARPGGGIRLRTRREGATAVLEVEDEGVGMEPSVAAQATEAFFTTKGAGQGTGLGLALCTSIVGAHRGELAIRSRPGEGTTVTVRLPLAAAGEAREA